MKHTGFPHWAGAGLSSFQSYYPLSLKTVDPNVLKEYSYHSLYPAGLLPDPLDFRGLTAFLNRKSPGEIRISTVLGHRGKSRNREIRLSSFPNSQAFSSAALPMPFANDLLTPRERIMRATKSSLQRLLHVSLPRDHCTSCGLSGTLTGRGRKGGRSLASTEHFKALWPKSQETWGLSPPRAASARSLPLSRPVLSSLVRDSLVSRSPMFPAQKFCKISGSLQCCTSGCITFIFKTHFLLVKEVIVILCRTFQNLQKPTMKQITRNITTWRDSHW